MSEVSSLSLLLLCTFFDHGIRQPKAQLHIMGFLCLGLVLVFLPQTWYLLKTLEITNLVEKQPNQTQSYSFLLGCRVELIPRVSATLIVKEGVKMGGWKQRWGRKGVTSHYVSSAVHEATILLLFPTPSIASHCLVQLMCACICACKVIVLAFVFTV